MRKIIHIDMDAFYASVEQRDNPALRGVPLVVAWTGNRSVVCAASYEARRFGIRSAMPLRTAEARCVQLVVVPPDFRRYKAVSATVRAILLRYTNLVEPLSLDEAYLDVSGATADGRSATSIAQEIRHAIRNETGLTASAGVAPNKFLAKIASDCNKPDGLKVIRPEEVLGFLAPLAVDRLPGVGKVTARRLAAIGIRTVGDLRAMPVDELVREFGRHGQRLSDLAHGVDERPVEPERPTLSISAEDTFEADRPLSELEPDIRRLAARVWTAARRAEATGHTVILKLKTRDFRILTRHDTPPTPPASAAQLADVAVALRARVDLPDETLYRLVGVGLGNFHAPEPVSDQPLLFSGPDPNPMKA